jgi:hypothetical protein
MVAALSRNGMPESCCKEVSDAYQVHLKQDLAKVPIHPLTKQVYFEEEGCEDVILVPVAAETIIREIHRQSQTGGRWLASRTLCAVGGANPVNGGSLCNDLGGAFLLLMAEPPNRTDPSLAARLKRGGKIYTRFSIRQEDIMTFIKAAPLEQLVGNDEKIKKELNAYNWFAGVLLAPLIDARHLTDDGILHSGENGAIGRFLDQCEGERNDPSVVADAVADVFNYIAQTYKELSAHSADSTCRAFLIEKMTEALL